MLLALILTPATPDGSACYMLRLAKLGPCGMDDRRIVVIEVIASGQLQINGEPLNHSALGERLETIFRTRYQRFAFVTAEAAVPFQAIADVIDVAAFHLDNVALLPPRDQLREGRFECPVVVPVHQLTAPSQFGR